MAMFAMESVMLPASMVLVQLFSILLVLLSKLALNIGMRPFVLLAYRNLIGAAAIAPLTFVFERKKAKIPNLIEWGWISMNATSGVILAMGLYYYGLRGTNATYSVVFLNLIPIVTSVVAILLRAEKLVFRKWHGKMKFLGIVTCVGGTMVVSLYKGKMLHHPWPTHLLRSHTQAAAAPAAHHNMVIGTLFLCGSCLGYAFWFIIQVLGGDADVSVGKPTSIRHRHPHRPSHVRMEAQVGPAAPNHCLLGGIQHRFALVLMSWAVKRRGPIYPSMFNSLAMVATVIMDSTLLGTSIFLGSMIGTVLVIVGLYTFLWGKGKELQEAISLTKNAGENEDPGDGGEHGEPVLEVRHRGDEIA
ncbi:hypothetical protein CFC21_053609 [Triticum aestivum]|uniref:WAT1-related protein n=3 Tax=Triticum TaxID=4564 RepID=A0A9R0W1Y6_TRITD|nr:WAT1-related protein At5g13670-like [Triticum aestivum]KAF7044377.1 hypothetical protein CFC21_053609 [Triticum aestivum]VAH95653.1 unnamed protein product [Triticum turgidum subsp. durum]